MAYIGPEPNPGQNREVDDISSGFNGGTAAFTLQVNGQNVSPGSSNNIIVSLGGVIQNPGTDYNIAGSTITFTTNPASGLSFWISFRTADRCSITCRWDFSYNVSSYYNWD